METVLLDDFLDEGIIREKSFREQVDNMDLNKYRGKKVIIKGCASVTIPTWAYLIPLLKLHRLLIRYITVKHDMQLRSLTRKKISYV